jgi:hypothetical protein
MTYGEKLRDPRWQKKRLEILQRDNWQCVECGETNKTLHVDHKFYEKGEDPWDCPDDLLQSLCVDCHESVGWLRQEIARLLAVFNYEELTTLHDLLLEIVRIKGGGSSEYPHRMLGALLAGYKALRQMEKWKSDFNRQRDT